MKRPVPFRELLLILLMILASMAVAFAVPAINLIFKVDREAKEDAEAINKWPRGH